MGWDCWYKGKLDNEKLQEKIVNFMQEYGDNNIIIKPGRSKLYVTEVIGRGFHDRFIKRTFNYFGIGFDNSLFDQFIFDRNSGGKIVTLCKIPAEFLPSNWENGYSDHVNDNHDVVWTEGGGVRRQAFMSFALAVIKFRWWPDLSIVDDSDDWKLYLDDFERYGIAEKILDESNGLNDCYMIWKDKHLERFPDSKKIINKFK